MYGPTIVNGLCVKETGFNKGLTINILTYRQITNKGFVRKNQKK